MSLRVFAVLVLFVLVLVRVSLSRCRFCLRLFSSRSLFVSLCFSCLFLACSSFCVPLLCAFLARCAIFPSCFIFVLVSLRFSLSFRISAVLCLFVRVLVRFCVSGSRCLLCLFLVACLLVPRSSALRILFPCSVLSCCCLCFSFCCSSVFVFVSVSLLFLCFRFSLFVSRCVFFRFGLCFVSAWSASFVFLSCFPLSSCLSSFRGALSCLL